MLPVTPPPMDSLAANPQPLQIASQRPPSAAKEINQPASQSEDARLHLSLSGDNLLSSGELALETLFPVYQAENQTLFVQGRVGKRRAQTTLNLGIGQRWLMNQEWLLGYNLFHDTLWQQGHHSRVGVGIEARQEYFGMAINGYYPVSRWRSLDKSGFYSQRPARGMDAILHANLPAYPQLGASIKAEHYWDKNVRLHDQSHSRSALTLGVNYTPISLVSAGYDYKIAKKGFKNQYQVHLTLNYRLGIPLAQQLDSSRVAQFRSLSGRLLEPVQRTNQMVLARRLEPKTSKLLQVLQQLVKAGLFPQVPVGSILEEDTFLHGAFSGFLDKNPSEQVIQAAFDLLLSGRWDNKVNELSPAMIVLSPLWPADTRLLLVDGTGFHDDPSPLLQNETLTAVFGQGSKEIKIRLRNGHYELIRGGMIIKTEGRGDCLFNAVSMGCGKPQSLENITKLRRAVTYIFLQNPELDFYGRAWDYATAP